jgi:hypothetical protein
VRRLSSVFRVDDDWEKVRPDNLKARWETRGVVIICNLAPKHPYSASNEPGGLSPHYSCRLPFSAGVGDRTGEVREGMRSMGYGGSSWT